MRQTEARRTRTWATLIATVVVVCLLAVAVEAQTKVVRRAYDNYVLDNWNHYLPCSELPAESAVRSAVDRHREAVRLIEAVNPGATGVEIHTPCPGRADVVIWYSSHEDRLAIEAILKERSFFGVPCRLQNR